MPYIEAITVRNGSTNNSDRLKAWICEVLDRNVRELFLDYNIYRNQIAELPQALFASKLVVLKLHMAMILNVPANSVSLPNLKVLELRKIIYKDDDAAENLISGCPVLEDLAITRGSSDNLVRLIVSSPVLKNLKVSLPETCSSNRRNDEKKLVIDAPALESIDISDLVTKEYKVVGDLSFVVKAKLHTTDWISMSNIVESDIMTSLHELLYKISNVKWLSLSSFTMDSLSCWHNDLPKFQYLNSLEVHAETSVSWEMMIKILCCSPVLENLSIREYPKWHAKQEVSHPKCLETSLKTVKVMGLSWHHKLENTTYFLEKSIINFDFWSTEDFKVEVPTKLSKIRKASPACQFYFC